MLSQKYIFAICLGIILFLEIRRGFLTRFPDYWKSVNPLKYLLLILGACAFGLLLLPFDPYLIQEVQEINHPVALQLIEVGKWLGKGNGAWGIGVILFLGFWAIRKRDWQLLAFGSLVTGALNGLVVHIIKFLVARARPLVDEGHLHFFDYKSLLEETGRYMSFPSGDVSTTAGVAVFFFLWLSKRYSWVFLVFPALTMLSRMQLDKHWPSDTLTALLLSFISGTFVLNYMRFVKSHPPQTDSKTKEKTKV
jgi:membrane-associated phospholipid phosphatase